MKAGRGVEGGPERDWAPERVNEGVAPGEVSLELSWAWSCGTQEERRSPESIQRCMMGNGRQTHHPTRVALEPLDLLAQLLFRRVKETLRECLREHGGDT